MPQQSESDMLMRTSFFKGPITACEFYRTADDDDNLLLIAYGPYLSLVDSSTFDQLTTATCCLKYSVIHKITFHPTQSDQICVFGQKSLNLLRLITNNNESRGGSRYEFIGGGCIEMNDWIFDVHWLTNDSLCLILAHNQFVHLNLNNHGQVEKNNYVYCTQKCMLYSARILDLNQSSHFQPPSINSIHVASGTIYNKILIWHALSGQILVSLEGHQGVIFNIEFNLEKRLLFSSSDDRFVCVWNLEVSKNDDDHGQQRSWTVTSGSLRARLLGHDARVWKSSFFSHNERNYLCSIGEDLKCCLWSLNDDNSLLNRFGTTRKCTKNIWSLCVNERTLRLVTGWADGGLRRFELRNFLLDANSLIPQTPTTLINAENETETMDVDSAVATATATTSNKSFEWHIPSSSSASAAATMATTSSQQQQEADFVRSTVLIDNRIIYCINAGVVYLIDAASEKNFDANNQQQRKLFQSNLLKTYSLFAKQKVGEKKWCLAIGTLNGFIYVIDLELNNGGNGDGDDEANKAADKIKISCLSFLDVEDEFDTVESRILSKKPGSGKICDLVWNEYYDVNLKRKRFFLLASYSFLDGLTHLYEMNSPSASNQQQQQQQLVLVARLYLPDCKLRWLTSFAVLDIKCRLFKFKHSYNNTNKRDVEEHSEESQSQPLPPLMDEEYEEYVWLVAGDKCGNLHFYETRTRPKGLEANYDEEGKMNSDDIYFIKSTRPIETIRNVTKRNAAISSIYLSQKKTSTTTITSSYSKMNNSFLKCSVICCCKDGFYRIYELNTKPHHHQLNNEHDQDEDESIADVVVAAVEPLAAPQSSSTALSSLSSLSFLKLVDKRQINSNIDIIESFIFDEEEDEDSSFHSNERDLHLAKCFYGDRFLLWNFHLNRALIDVQCGGAYRSWDLEFNKNNNDSSDSSDAKNKSTSVEIRFIYIKSRTIMDVRKVVDWHELYPTRLLLDNHLSQVFHGNTINVCKYFNEHNLLTAGEDTQIIINEFNDDTKEQQQLKHQFHLNGHDSVVKCLDFFKLDDETTLLVSAGGKANVRLWKLMTSSVSSSPSSPLENRELIRKVVQLTEMKQTIKNRRWQLIDRESNPDIRYMDVKFLKSQCQQNNSLFVCFACSDGQARIYTYDFERNQLRMHKKLNHTHCLICIRTLSILGRDYVIVAGTDGSALIWNFQKCNSNNNSISSNDSTDTVVLSGLNQSGINGLDLFTMVDDQLSSNVEFVLATGGDDARISVLKLRLNDNEETKFSVEKLNEIGKEMAHASSIVSVKIVDNGRKLISVGKDQRLILWSIDLATSSLTHLRTRFINVADVCSMDIIQANRSSSNNILRISLVGVGLEIIDLII